MYCPKCGFECTETDKFCKNCGNKLVELQDTEKNIIQSDVNEYRDDENNESMIKCPYCYSPVPRHAKKCPKCGEWLEKDTPLGCYTILSIIVFLSSLGILNSALQDGFTAFLMSLAIVFILWIYFIPAWIAEIRNNPSTTAIFVVNLFFGWSLIGWVIALIWALSGGRR